MALINLNGTSMSLIEMDTGAIVGSNVVAVFLPEDDQHRDDILSDDGEAWQYAHEYGRSLFVEDNS